MIRKKNILISLIALVVMFLCYIFIVFNDVHEIGNSCLSNDFNTIFDTENSITLNKVYDFSKILACESWDEIIIISGERASRAAIFLKEGVVLPKIDYYSNYLSGSLVIYLIKDGKSISGPLYYWQSNFIFLEGLNGFDYILLKKEEAIFKCVKLETIGFEKEILTFKLIEPPATVSL